MFIRDFDDFVSYVNQLKDYIKELEAEEYNSEELNDLKYDYDKLEIKNGELELTIEDLNKEIKKLENKFKILLNTNHELHVENKNLRQIISD